MVKKKEQKNKSQTRPPVVVILGHVDHGKCVAPSTLIPLTNGEILSAQKIWDQYKDKQQVKKYKDEGHIIETKNGPEIFSFGDYKIKRRKITHLWKLKAPKRMIRAEIASGDTIETTPEHPFFTFTPQGKIKQKRADLIKKDDFILIPQTLEFSQYNLNQIKVHLVQKIGKLNNFVVLISDKNKKAKKFLKKLKDTNKQELYRKNIFSTNPIGVLKYKRFRARDFVKLCKYFNFSPLETYQIIDTIKNASEKWRSGKTSNKITLPQTTKDFYKLGYILGSFAGDGDIRKVFLHNNDKEIQSTYAQYIGEVFGLKTKITQGHTCQMVETNGGATLRRFFTDILGLPKNQKSLNIDIPFLGLSSKIVLKGFIEGLFDTDGYVSKINHCAEFTSKSEKIIKSLSTALLGFGIHSVIYPKNGYYYLRIANKPYLEIFSKKFSFRHHKKRDRIKLACKKSSTSRIFDSTPLSGHLLKSFYINEHLLPYFSKYRSYKLLSRPFLERLLQFKNEVNIHKVFLAPAVKHLINPGEVSCVRVRNKKIIKNKYKFVYDFTVPKNHNFIAERMIIHNTSILDYIRKSKVAERESGGITQHTGAYQVEHQDKLITFIDTPGHEAFSAMRSRGARVADIAILVVAAEEGIKPQTKEAIKHIKKTGIPAIVAINKIDKQEAQPEKVKGELAKHDMVVESFNGSVPSINVSAKTGQGIEELLEMILLVADMEELTSDSDQTATGVIVESRRDSQRGNTATLLIRAGILSNKDIIGTDSAFGKIKIMEDFQGKSVKEALASAPIVVTGFNQVPQVGEKFRVFNNFDEAQNRVDRKAIKRQPEDSKEVLVVDPDKKVLNIILKCDVHGCLEAIRESFKSIPDDEVVLRILKAEAGDVTESDIKLAESAKAKIIGFRVKTKSNIQRLADQKKVRVLTFDIIYELIQGVREILSKLLEPEVTKNVLGQLKVLAVFRTDKDRQIIGGKVMSGQVKQGASLDVIRPARNASRSDAGGESKIIGKGRVAQLQRDKKDIDEVNKGQECGIQFKGNTTIEKGDILEIYQEERKKREIE